MLTTSPVLVSGGGGGGSIATSGTGNPTLTGNMAVNGTVTITSTSANALTVGANGATNPVLQIDDSTASVATGIVIKGAATGGTTSLTVIDSGANANLSLSPKGTGSVTITASPTSGNGTLNLSLGVWSNPNTLTIQLGDTGNFHYIQVGNGIYGTISSVDGWNINTGGSNDIKINPGGSVKITSSTSTSLAIGRQGVTNPVLNIDSSVASVVTGVNIKGGAAGTKPILSVISTDSALGLTIQALTTTNTLTINDTLAAATSPLLVGAATDVITAGVTDAYTGGLRLTPTINAATAQTVTRYNYLDLNNVTLGGAGPAAITDAAVFRFDAAAGTHKALAADAAVAVTFTSLGPTGAQTTIQGWVKINVNGTIRFIPFW